MKWYLSCMILWFSVAAEPAAAQLLPGNDWWHGIPRALRYHPEGTDFVITNGNRRFTRALYGANAAFRVEAGDLPEFALYLPGMGGNWKFGLIQGDSSKWLINARKITARYRPGAMLYEIEDNLLGKARLYIEVLAMADAEGMLVKARLEGAAAPVQLCWAFGGVSGKKFKRDGDMGVDPESGFYLHPENCRHNRYTLQQNNFSLEYGTDKNGAARTLYGVMPAGADIRIVDAARQSTPAALWQSGESEAPAVAGRLALANGAAHYWAVQVPSSSAPPRYADLPAAFAKAEQARKTLADRIQVHTPDPYINTLGGALSMAADAIWESPSYLHGAVGWRMRLNGWRGAYAADALGWHDRAREHFKSYALSQVTSPASGPVTPDTALHLARQLEKMGTAIFSSGYISRNPGGDQRPHHYDMNLVYMDQLLRHFYWTGDLSFIKEIWPVLKRHLAWEQRNFDMDGDGLYDAYAAIWASDALQYSGGGVTHTSAYNYLANRLAADIAPLIGEDPAPYRKEAAHILQAMNNLLWMPRKGVYAEYKDAMGRKALHPAAALWSIYHSIDSRVPDAFQAWQCLHYVDHEIPHIPVRAAGLTGSYYTLSTSNWMPYVWSINNVALAEVLHTALAYWQGGRPEDAFVLWKSALLESMYLGGSPGNFQQISFYDAVKGEAYRDFADPVGVAARALTEGLFGITPDMLAGVLTIRPGFPADWKTASLRTPDITFDFNANGQTYTYNIVPAFPGKMGLRLQIGAAGAGIQLVSVNGRKVAWKLLDTAIGRPMIEISAGPAAKYTVQVVWNKEAPDTAAIQGNGVAGGSWAIAFPHAEVLKVYDPQQVFRNVQYNGKRINGRLAADTGHHVAFAQLKQGAVTWWQPLQIRVVNPVSISGNAAQFSVHNHTASPLTLGVRVNAGYDTTINVPANAASGVLHIPVDRLLPGANEVIVADGGEQLLKEVLVSWDVPIRGNPETVDLSAHFNDKVTQIFRNRYLSPRPAVPTLQLPTQGIGDWCAPLMTANIDDAGLRRLAGESNRITLPQGIPFRTPGDSISKNIVFTSRWDNYPASVRIPLSGKARHAYLLMAGSTNAMQSRFDNGIVTIHYTDGTADSLVLRNPETWWPIEQDYYEDGFAFARHAQAPLRVHLKTGNVMAGGKSGAYNGKFIDGGAATVLDMPLDARKDIRDITVGTLANDVVIGLMSVTLLRPEI